jgi:hypothetical protein
MGDVLGEAARQTSTELALVPVDDGVAAQTETPFPLWTPGPAWAAWAEIDVARAVDAGLRFRLLEDTVKATLTSAVTVDGVGPTPEQEDALLAAWQSR